MMKDSDGKYICNNCKRGECSLVTVSTTSFRVDLCSECVKELAIYMEQKDEEKEK